FNKVKVSKNDFFSIVNKKIIKSSKNLFDVASVTTKKTLGRGKIKDCYIFVGADTSKEDINKFSDYLKNTYKINANIFFTQIQNYPISLVFVY
ncbi:MAG: hypothetical protein LBF02_02405, partial [Mycoplasmataceae bacterium]|nr:hypothetical protein [Mycoplasmataceae bacterium]